VGFIELEIPEGHSGGDKKKGFGYTTKLAVKN
jgi:hypothetical protein